MSKIKKTDAKDFNKLKNIGLEFEAPQDEYSYQPDSGSTANGLIGKQEYGIDIDIDAQPYENEPFLEGNNIEDSSLPIPGESEYSQSNRLPQDEIVETQEALTSGFVKSMKKTTKDKAEQI